MITDYFKSNHLEKLYDQGWRRMESTDRALTIFYRSRGECWQAFLTWLNPAEYRLSTQRLKTGNLAHAVIRAAELGEFLEEELIHAEPGDSSPGSGE